MVRPFIRSALFVLGVHLHSLIETETHGTAPLAPPVASPFAETKASPAPGIFHPLRLFSTR